MCDAQFPGAVHDSRAFGVLDLSRNPQAYFGRNQYLIGDSAYKVTPRLIAPYKKPRGGILTQDKKDFNRSLSSLRVRVEHTIGILKARFASLRCLPTPPRMDNNKMTWTYAWIGGCVILHNLLLDSNDSWEPPADEIAMILRGEVREPVQPRDLQRERDEREHLVEEVNNGRREELLLEFLRVRQEEAEVDSDE